MKNFASSWKSVGVRSSVLREYQILLNKWIGANPLDHHYSLSGMINRVLVEALDNLSEPLYPDPSRDKKYDEIDEPIR